MAGEEEEDAGERKRDGSRLALKRCQSSVSLQRRPISENKQEWNHI